MYALPYEWYEKYGVRRYGFHGTSFLYVAKRAALLLGKDPFECNLVCLHIGNGVSANAIKNGVSYDTSMGLTPLEGLVMGTRAGDHDAAIDLMVMEKEGIAPGKMNDILNKKSGLLGITGKHTDRRDVQKAAEAGDARAQLAIDVEAYRIKKYIGAYSAAIGGADAIVFTAGVGEMSDLIREKSLEGLEFMGIKLDKDKNRLAKTRNAETEISAADSKVKVFVIPTDEERVNIEDVIAILEGKYDEHTRFTYRFQSPDYVNSQREQDFVKECEAKPGLKAIQVKPKKRSYRGGPYGCPRVSRPQGKILRPCYARGWASKQLVGRSLGLARRTRFASRELRSSFSLRSKIPCPLRPRIRPSSREHPCAGRFPSESASDPNSGLERGVFTSNPETRARMRSVRASRSRRSIFSMSEWA